MTADIKGALANLNKSYKVFEYKEKPMTKQEVKIILEYGLKKGYGHMDQITDEEIEWLIKR